MDAIQRVHLAHDFRNVIGHVCREHARAKQPRIFVVMGRIALLVHLEPFRMCRYGIFPVQVRTHSRNDVYAALLGCRTALTEEVTITEVFALAMEWYFGLI